MVDHKLKRILGKFFLDKVHEINDLPISQKDKDELIEYEKKHYRELLHVDKRSGQLQCEICATPEYQTPGYTMQLFGVALRICLDCFTKINRGPAGYITTWNFPKEALGYKETPEKPPEWHQAVKNLMGDLGEK
jgi:hypothetical protein